MSSAGRLFFIVHSDVREEKYHKINVFFFNVANMGFFVLILFNQQFLFLKKLE